MINNNFFRTEDIDEIINFLDKEYEKFENKNILLTGGRGFLGRYFTQFFLNINKLLNKPCKLISVDNLITSGSFGDDLPKDDNFIFYKKDITQKIIIDEKIDFIIHAAGIASPYYYKKWPLKTLEVATTGLKNVLDLANKNKCKLVFFSSSEIYGNPDNKNIPTLESYNGNVSCLGPRACYDESKRLGETLVRVYSDQYGLDASIIRPFNVYGPGMQKNDYRVLPNFISKIVNNERLQVYGNGNQTRTYCYITDAMNGFIRVLLKGNRGEPYNIGNSQPELSVLNLVKYLEKILPDQKINYDIIDHPDSYPSDEPQRRCPNLNKALYHLNYTPKINVEDGIKRYFDWSLNNY